MNEDLLYKTYAEFQAALKRLEALLSKGNLTVEEKREVGLLKLMCDIFEDSLFDCYTVEINPEWR